MAVNKFAGNCAVCGARVAAKAGNLTKNGRRWLVTHLACDRGETVDTIRFSSGETFTRNSRGRCEDAPCCGCCTI
jgi:hypothetical protein